MLPNCRTAKMTSLMELSSEQMIEVVHSLTFSNFLILVIFSSFYILIHVIFNSLYILILVIFNVVDVAFEILFYSQKEAQGQLQSSNRKRWRRGRIWRASNQRWHAQLLTKLFQVDLRPSIWLRSNKEFNRSVSEFPFGLHSIQVDSESSIKFECRGKVGLHISELPSPDYVPYLTFWTDAGRPSDVEVVHCPRFPVLPHLDCCQFLASLLHPRAKFNLRWFRAEFGVECSSDLYAQHDTQLQMEASRQFLPLQRNFFGFLPNFSRVGKSLILFSAFLVSEQLL